MHSVVVCYNRLVFIVLNTYLPRRLRLLLRLRDRLRDLDLPFLPAFLAVVFLALRWPPLDPAFFAVALRFLTMESMNESGVSVVPRMFGNI